MAATKLLNTDTVVAVVMPAGGGLGVKRRPDVSRIVRLSRFGSSEAEEELLMVYDGDKHDGVFRSGFVLRVVPLAMEKRGSDK